MSKRTNRRNRAKSNGRPAADLDQAKDLLRQNLAQVRIHEKQIDILNGTMLGIIQSFGLEPEQANELVGFEYFGRLNEAGEEVPLIEEGDASADALEEGD